MRIQCDTFLKHPGFCADLKKLLHPSPLPWIQANTFPVQEASQPHPRARAPLTLMMPLSISRKGRLSLWETTSSVSSHLPTRPRLFTHRTTCPSVHGSSTLGFTPQPGNCSASLDLPEPLGGIGKAFANRARLFQPDEGSLQCSAGAAWHLHHPGLLRAPLLLLRLNSLPLFFSLIVRGWGRECISCLSSFCAIRIDRSLGRGTGPSSDSKLVLDKWYWFCSVCFSFVAILWFFPLQNWLSNDSMVWFCSCIDWVAPGVWVFC